MQHPRVLWIEVCLSILFVGIFAEFVQQQTSDSHYIAAVVEYKPNGTPWDSTPNELILKNARNYKNLINEASGLNADIIVFPEYGLTTLGVPRDRDNAKPFLLRIPDLGNNPCNDSKDSGGFNSSNPVELLSCAAAEARIYVVINLGEILSCEIDDDACPNDGVFQYNTNVVFDRNGTIIAKYHKTKLYFEEQFDSPSPPEYSIFETDFGVTFGQFICYDIIFYDPAVELVKRGIQNLIFPSAWVDELPFLMAIQSHALWAAAARVNLLASGYHQPIGGQLGSGIYSSVAGPLNYVFDPESGSQIILSPVPKIPYESTQTTGKSLDNYAKTSSINKSNQNKDSALKKLPLATYHSYLKENLTNYNSTILDLQNKNSEEICHGTFCCSTNYIMASQSNHNSANHTYNYRLIAFDGIRKTAQETGEFSWQVCGIIKCFNTSLSSCSIRGTIDNEEEHYLEKFEELELSGWPFDDEFVMKPALNTLDVYFDIIPFELFTMSNSSTLNNNVCTNDNSKLNMYKIFSNQLSTIPVQSISIINRTY